MRALRVAARAAVAGGVILVGASCSADRLTVPGADRTAALEPAEAAVWGSTRVDVTPDVDTIALGTSQQLAMEVGDSKKVSATVRWTSLDDSVVTVSAAGVATAVGGGTARVVGKVGPLADTAVVVVSVSVASVVAAPESGEVTIGQKAQLGATTSDALGHPIDGVAVEWSSLNPGVASVSGAGLVTGVALGEAKIVAKAAGQSDTASVRVSPVAVAAVGVAPSTLSLSAGASAQLSAAATSASGDVLADRLATWSSSDESVAKVSSTGQVSAVGSGSANVTATIDGKSASAAVNVAAAAVAKITVAANATSLSVGQTTQVNATVYDASDAVLTSRAVTWSSSNAGIATVSASGVVTAVAQGSVTITGTSEGAKASVTITVAQAAVATVTVNMSPSSLSVGQTALATASAYDVAGQALVGRAVTWSVDKPALASVVGSTGVVTALAAGSVTVTATVDGKGGSTVVSIATAPVAGTPTAPVAANTAAAILPKAVPTAGVPAVTGATINVAAGQDLQAALDAAKLGDEVVLASGATFVGNYVIKARTGTGWLTIRSSASLPPQGTRVTPSSAAGFAKILTNSNEPALRTDPGVHHIRIAGLDISNTSGMTHVNSLLNLGDASWAQNTLAAVPQQIILDHMYVHGTSSVDLRRCVGLNSAWTAVVDSYLTECHSNDGDAQAIFGANGPGPYLIQNNTLEGSGENIMFGGSDPASAELVPADITIRGNHIRKPMTWQGKWMAKNLIELKLGKRVLIEGNMIENSWVSGQTGFAMVFWSVNQGGPAPWSETSDVTVRYNVIRNAANGFQLSDRYWGNVSPRMARVAILHNRITGMGNPAMGSGGGQTFQVSGDVPDLMIAHNTTEGTGPWLYFASQPVTPIARMTVVDNIGFRTGLAVRSDYGNGSAAWDPYAGLSGGAIGGNVLAGGGANHPANNSYPVGGSSDATSAIGFMNAAGGDYRLASTSPFKGKGTDGTDPGANNDVINSRLSGVTLP